MGRRKRYSVSDATRAARGGTVGDRIVVARMVLSADELAKVSQEALGARVAEHLNDPRPITGATVSRWETGESVPDLETLAAIGAVCRVDPGWIAFGAASSAADPRDGMIEGLFDQSRAHFAKVESWHQQISPLLDERKRNRKADSERRKEFARARKRIDQIKNSAQREARLAQFQAEFMRLDASAKERDAELEQRIRTKTEPRPKLTASVDLVEVLEDALAIEKARLALAEHDEADQRVRRTSKPEPTTPSAAKARRS